MVKMISRSTCFLNEPLVLQSLFLAVIECCLDMGTVQCYVLQTALHPLKAFAHLSLQTNHIETTASDTEQG